MDALRIGRSVRAIRVRLAWRQLDLAEKAGVSRSFVSNVERGELARIDLERLERVCRALGADLDIRVRWRGEGLDRLLDEAHAILVDRVVAVLKACGWEVAVEVTFNVFGDRGSIDVFTWHRSTGSLLVIEVKSVVPDAQATLLPLDRKVRLGLQIGRERGWTGRAVSRLLVLGDRTVNRRRIAVLGAMFDAALPARGHEVRGWLKRPVGTLSGLLFLSDAPSGGARRASAGRLRVNPRGGARDAVG
jgi:transcriptional regulator with XRE-family HTH domain